MLDLDGAAMITARRMPLPQQPARICIVDLLPAGTIRHDMLALSAEDARRVGLELIAAANAADIEAAGGVPPVAG